ncbi:TonB-dependent receptor [Caulobacter endophyticus]|uniref:TonB-dependent receptor n=1 Tax=Caulobacter endophyticus TaxID=2172652 RepID=UPI002410275A|nr:TonB-dependent receptor [Caulobacter endophyticus]MDG2527208.1 TonB-dependent receptor [Caulobacter endophyticus]
MRIHKSGLLTAAAVAVLASVAAPAHAVQASKTAEARVTVAIPAQDLGRALQTLSRDTGLSIVFDPALTRGRTSNAVSGAMTAREALRRMIAGSGIEAREVRGVLMLERQSAQAEVATPDAVEVDGVVVGYAAGLRRSLDAKRKADFISDVISADDMGDLPANNVAESLSRLPGVNAVRNHTTGEGDRITIRGLSTELNNYTMNGVRMGGTGSRDDNFYRGVRLSFLPPEGIDSITVIKSLTPDRDGDALGGSIDIRTPTAFDHGKTYGVLSVSAGMLDKFDNKKSGEIAGSFGRQFNSNWGVFATGSWSRRKSQFEQNGVDGDNQPSVWYADSETLGWDPETFVMRGMDLAVGETEVERRGVNTSLDYRGARHDFHLRGQFNEYTKDEFSNRLNFRNDTGKNSARLTQVDKSLTNLASPEASIIGTDAKLGRIYSYTTAQIVDRDRDGRITDADRSTKSYYSLDGASGTWDPQGFRLRRFWEGSRETGSLASVNLGGVSRWKDFTADYDLSYAKSEDNIDDSYEMEFRSDKYGWLGNKGVKVTNFGDSRFPKWVLNDAGMAAIHDNSQYDFSGLSGEIGGAQERLWQGQVNLEWRPAGTWLEAVKTGGKVYSSKRSTYSGEFMDLDADGTLADFSRFYGKEVTSLFDGEYSGLYRLGTVIDNKAMLAELQRAMAGDSTFFEGFATDPGNAELSGEDSFTFKEDIFAGYLMATARFDRAQVIGGVRVERTNNTIDAYILDEVQGGRYSTDKSDFTNILPSIHLNYSLNDRTKMRAAIWTSFARPDIARMSSAREYGYDSDPDGDGKVNPTSQWVLVAIEQGNPDLKPMKAVNYDLSIERYNGDTGAYSLGLFYKDIKNFLYRSSSSNIRDGTAGTNVSPDGVTVSMPNNGKWAKVYGIELSAQQVFHWLPGPLSKLGASVNLTLQKSEAETGISWHPAGYTLPLMETPERVANVQLFWEYKGWEAYAAYSYQSEFLEGIQDFGNNPYEQDYEFVDLNLRRKLWKGATASMQVQNLFDNHTYWYTAGDSTSSSRAYIKNGRSISFGLNYVF